MKLDFPLLNSFPLYFVDVFETCMSDVTV